PMAGVNRDAGPERPVFVYLPPSRGVVPGARRVGARWVRGGPRVRGVSPGCRGSPPGHRAEGCGVLPRDWGGTCARLTEGLIGSQITTRRSFGAKLSYTNPGRG